MVSTIKIVMADDHEIFREGIAGMFSSNTQIQLLDQAADGKLLISAVEKHKPDVVLTDIQMDVMDGMEATRIIHKRYPGISIIAMSMFEDYYTIIEMLKAGAIGYLVKNARKQVVIDAIIAAYKGESFYCRTASQKISALISSGKLDPKNLELLDFNPTELRIIKLICMIKETKEIADELGVHKKTIDKYRQDIMEKAEVKTMGELMMWAVRNGVYRP
jgi:two-component system, NarL family, response regulator NreC